MSSKNIFEVLQNIAENTESNEKFLNILKENGFTGTLEEAENQINQQAQVVLNNLTTEDLQNIAGGKSLMNDKLKKALAVGGASLMAAGTVVPSSLAANKNDAKKFADSALNYVKKNPVHTGVTTILGLTTAALLVKSIFGGKSVTNLTHNEIDSLSYLRQIDLSNDNDVLKFVTQLDDAACKFNVEEADGVIKIQFTATKENVLKTDLYNEQGSEPKLTIKDLTLTLLEKLDDSNQTYIDQSTGLTEKGLLPAKTLCKYIVEGLHKHAETADNNAATKVKTAQEALDKKGEADDKSSETKALADAKEANEKTKQKLEILEKLKQTEVIFAQGEKKTE